MWGCLTFCKMIDQRGLISQRAIIKCLCRFYVNSWVYNLLDLMSKIRVKSIEIEFIQFKFKDDFKDTPIST